MAINCPEGTRDLLPDEAMYWDTFKQMAWNTFSNYGYVPIYTPEIEQTELFVRGIGEATDVVSKEMFAAISGENLKRLMDGQSIKSKSRLSLRPEGTAGVVRSVVQHDLVPQGAPPVKLMYAGPMFRAERPQRGRQRQFNQIGVECLGSESAAIDAEAIIMVMRFYERIGIKQDASRLLVNSMGCASCRPAYRNAVLEYMQSREGELCETCHTRMQLNPLRAFDCKAEGCKAVMADAPKITEYLCEGCKSHYTQVLSLLDMAGLTYVEDPTLVRGLDYYTRTVFEVQADSGGAQNAIGGGGRYDGLAEEIGGRPTPGFGFALGYERCVLTLQEAGFQFANAKRCDVFVATVDAEVASTAFQLVQRLRDIGRIAEMDYQDRSLKSQFKLADRLNATVVAIVGPDELKEGQIRIRNMSSHEEMAVSVDEVLAVIDNQL